MVGMQHLPKIRWNYFVQSATVNVAEHDISSYLKMRHEIATNTPRSVMRKLLRGLKNSFLFIGVNTESFAEERTSATHDVICSPEEVSQRPDIQVYHYTTDSWARGEKRDTSAHKGKQ